MAYLRPGVYVEETLNPVAPIAINDSTSVAAFVGVTDRGPVVPTLVTSWSQYTSLYGSWGTNNNVTTAVYLFFANGGAQCYVQRVVAGSPVAANRILVDQAATTSITAISRTSGSTTATLTGSGIYAAAPTGTTVVVSGLTSPNTEFNGTWVVTGGATNTITITSNGTSAVTQTGLSGAISTVATLKLEAANVGAWGNSLWYEIAASSVSSTYFNLTVWYGTPTSAGVAVERYSDLTMLTTDTNYAPAVINAKSSYIKATDLNVSDSWSTADNPASTSGVQIALLSGSDGTAPTTANIASGVTGLDVVTQALVLNAPGLTTATDVNALLNYAGGRGDVFVVIDGVNDTVANQVTLAGTYNSAYNSYGAVYYPQLTIPNPQSAAQGATITANPGGAIVGQYIATDTSRGVFKAPAGLGNRLSGVVSVTKLSNSDLDSLNSAAAPVNAIRYIPGSGIVVMGARTLKAGYADKFVPVRRSLIYIKKSLQDLTRYAVFEPNDFRLWNRLGDTVTKFLTDYWAQGGLRGQTPQSAFFVKCDSENNPLVSIDNGEVHIEVGVALQRPAEFVIIRISQYDGGSVVTVS